MYCTQKLTLTAGTRALNPTYLRVPCFATKSELHALVMRFLDNARMDVLGIANACTIKYDLDGCKGTIR